MFRDTSTFRVPKGGLAVIFAFTFPMVALAQNTAANNDSVGQDQHATHKQAAESSLSDQIKALQVKVRGLEAALKQSHQGTRDSSGMKMGSMGGKKMGMAKGMETKSDMTSMPGMTSMGGMTGMGMMSGQGMGMGGSGMGGLGMGSMGSMGNPGMKMMGQMQGMGSMQMATALPGFPGASHIYHIGATAFFLDHPQHITLTTEQQTQLNGIKEKTLLGQATFDRWIAQAEQEVWVLTSADAPDASKVEAQVREIAKLGADKRIAYIKAVGEAAAVLTNEQRQALVGSLPPQHAAGGTKNQH